MEHKKEKALLLCIVLITVLLIVGGILCSIFLPGSRTSQTQQWSTTQGANPMHTNSIDVVNLFPDGLPSPVSFANMTNPIRLVIDSYWRVYVRNSTGELDVFDTFGHQLWHQHNFQSNFIMSGDNKNIFGYQSSPIILEQFSPESGKRRHSFDTGSYYAMSQLVAEHKDSVYTTLENDTACYFASLSSDLRINWALALPEPNVCTNFSISLSFEQDTAILAGTYHILQIDLDKKQISRTFQTCDVFNCLESSYPQVVVVGDGNIIFTYRQSILFVTSDFQVQWQTNLTLSDGSGIIADSAVSLNDNSVLVSLVVNADTEESELHAIDMNSGKTSWIFSVPSEYGDRSPLSVPSIVQDTLYVCGGEHLFQLDVLQGKIIHQTSVFYHDYQSNSPCAYIDERGVIYTLHDGGITYFTTSNISVLPKIKWGTTTYLICTFIIVMIWWSICSALGMCVFQNQPLGLAFASFISSNEIIELTLNILSQKPVTRKLCGCIKFHFKFRGRIYFLCLFLFSKLVSLIIVIILQSFYQTACFDGEPSYWQCGGSVSSIIRQAFVTALIGIPLNVVATIIVGMCVKTLQLDISTCWKLIVHISCGCIFFAEICICIALVLWEINIFFSIVFTWILSLIVDAVTTPVIRAIICGDTKVARKSGQNALHYFWYGPPDEYHPLH